MIFKSGLLSQNGWENIALTFSKCRILDCKREFTSSYGAGTKFIRNTGLYGISRSYVDLGF